MKVIIGLGNPGKQYENARHNVGFMMMDKIRKNYDFPDFEFNKKFNADISSSSISPSPPGRRWLESADSGRETDEGETTNKKTILVKPLTFMNSSGDSVRAILDFYKLTPGDIIIIHDEIDLPLEEYKIATSSGSAGHNGVEDIISKIGTKNFTRIRIGVANPDLRSKIDTSDFVLQNFSGEELKKMEKISKKVLEEIEKLL